jgi:Uma2 family endonuclease
MSAVLTERMTLAEFDALPEDPTVDRMLLFGEVVEKPMTVRNRRHAEAEAAVATILRVWRDSLRKRLGKVYSGEVGCDLPDSESRVGIDAAYFDQATLDQTPPKSPYLVGPPVVAVEVLSPSDVVEEINRKIKAYLKAGCPLVWIIDPDLEMLTVHRRGGPPETLSGEQEVCGDPHLPGLRFQVRELFE